MASTSPTLTEEDIATSQRRIPVVEIFGPTIQGEGVDQGIPCHFIRFGGCDYRCSWCDSPHAVLPQLVRNATKMTVEEIVDTVLHKLPPGPRWIIFSGGNPCLHELGELIDALHMHKYDIAVETQGTRLKQWLHAVDRIAISPKPPSSEMQTDMKELTTFLAFVRRNRVPAFLKIVVFDSVDYHYAKQLHIRFPAWPMYLSACNDSGLSVAHPDTVDGRCGRQIAWDLIMRGRDIANRLMIDPDMWDVKLQIQNHVLYWGNARGR